MKNSLFLKEGFYPLLSTAFALSCVQEGQCGDGGYTGPVNPSGV